MRDYKEDDAGPICRLFYETVRSVNLRDYSPEQVRAWAPAPPAPAVWHARMSGRHTLVAEGDDGLAGFLELEDDGHSLPKPASRPARFSSGAVSASSGATSRCATASS